MSEKEKQVAESLRKNTSGLSAEQMQRLGDIAYGMLLTKELARRAKKVVAVEHRTVCAEERSRTRSAKSTSSCMCCMS